jgi:hypothetical protein
MLTAVVALAMPGISVGELDHRCDLVGRDGLGG